MMRMIRRTLLVGGFFIFLLWGSSALLTSAQTANTQCPSGQIQCPAVGSSPAGCYATCPTASSSSGGTGGTGTTTASVQCSSGQMTCWDPVAQKNYCHTGTTCPMICGSGQVKCPSSSGGGEYCYNGTTCPTAVAGTIEGQSCTSPQWWCVSKSKCVTTATECDSGGSTGTSGSTCPTGQIQCPAVGSSPAGCYATCPTASSSSGGTGGTGTTTASVQCSSGQMTCWDPVAQKNYCHTGTTCPMICGSDMVKLNCTDANGKSYEMCASKNNPTCPTTTGSVSAMTEEQMKAECLKKANMQWCLGTGTEKNYCAQWCSGSSTVGTCASGMVYCAASGTRPAGCYASCTIEEETPQKRCEQQAAKESNKWRWCKYQTMNASDANTKPGYDGWCADTTSQWYQPCDESECKAKSGWNWCKSSWTNEWSGKTQVNYWCSKECPVNDEESCKSAGREWCPSTDNMIMKPASGSKGWCARKEDPPCTKASCSEKKGSKWCTPKYGGTGWCSLNGSCPDDEVVIFQWPTNKGQCEKYMGNWCQDSMSFSGGWCTMGTEKCMDSKGNKDKVWCWWEEKFADKWDDCQKPPQTQSDCTSQGKNWCESVMKYTPATSASMISSGWCSKTICPKAGLNNCPDGKTHAKKLEDCPTKATTGQKCWDGSYEDNGACPPEPKRCPAGFVKDPSTGDCYKTCSGGKKIKEGESCSDVDKREQGELTEKEKEILKKKADKAAELQQYATFFRQVRSSKIASEIEKLLSKLADDQRYILSYWTDAKFEEIDKSIAALKIAKEAAEKRGSVGDDTDFKVDIEKAAIDEVRNSLGLTNNEQRLTELLDATLPELERNGIVVKEEIKGRLNDAAKLIEEIKAATTVEEVNGLAQRLVSILKVINDKDRPYLKGLLGLKSMTEWYTAKIEDISTMFEGDAEAEIDGLKKQITDAGYNPKVSFDEITKRIVEARAALNYVKEGKAVIDPLGYLKRNALQKLAQAQNEMDDIATLLEIKEFIASIEDKEGYAEKYRAQLADMKKSRTALLANRKLPARERTTKARAMLAEINRLQSDINTFKTNIAQLKTLEKRGVKVSITKIVDQLNDIIDRREGIRPETSVEDELMKLEGSFELPTFDIPSLRRAFLGTQGIAQFFGKSVRALVRL